MLWENRLEAAYSGIRSGDGVWSGLTDNYLRVLSAAPADIGLHNRITPVHLLWLEGDVLWGEITTQ